jgi:hypothetical protein
MIDDYAQAMDLMHKMEDQLPIPARPTGSYVRAMREHGTKLDRRRQLQIERVFYLGDEGGIACNVTPPPAPGEAVVISLTHLRVDARHPLAQEIRAYQQERTRRLARSGESGEPSSFTVRPRKKRRR